MSLPRMSLHIGDYLKDTQHLGPAEHGTYLLLIMHYWTHGGLPDDDRSLAAIAKHTLPAWRRMRPVIEAFFTPGWRHKRIDEELAVANDLYEQRAAAGRASGAARRKTAERRSSKRPALFEQPITPTDKDKGRGGDAHASGIAQAAFSLSERVLAAWGLDAEDPRAIGTAYAAQRWLDAGWDADLCVSVVREVCARHAPESVKYFEKPIARAHAAQAAPVPVAAPPKQEVIHAADRGRNVVDALDRLIRQGVDFGERPALPGTQRAVPGTSPGAARLLPDRTGE